MSEPRKIKTDTALGRSTAKAPQSAARPASQAAPQPRSTDPAARRGPATPRKINRTRSLNGTVPRQPGSAGLDDPYAARGSRQTAGGSVGSGGPKPPQKKKSTLKVVLVTLTAIVGVFFITALVVLRAIAPGAGSLSLNQLIHTPREYSGDVVNILVCGVDWEEGRSYSGDATSNDGMTDMIMYVNFDVKNKEIHMLQIPRNTLVTSDSSVASNYQINSVALTSGNNISALAQLLYDQYKLPVDYYVTINMQSLGEIVDTFGGIEVYVPHTIEYNGSALSQGYQTMDGAAAEFFVRNRKGAGYDRSDLDRLNMQRYFYSALLRRFRTMTIWDAAKLIPVFMDYLTTDVPASAMVSLGVSVLNTQSSSIMMCQLPVYNAADYYNGNSVMVAAPEADADLLNQYFRTYMDPVPASELNLMQFGTSGEPSDPNVQFMGQLDEEANQGQQNENLDGSFTVVSTPEPSAPADSAGSNQ